MLDRLLDEFLMESYQNYSDYQNAYSAHFDTLFRAHEVMKESVDDIDMYQAKMCAQESANDIMGKIKTFFKNLIEKIKQFIKDIKTAVKNKFQQIQLQRKLTEIKKILMENRNDREVSTKKVKIFDSLKYNAMYNKYIAMIQKEITNLSITKFKSIEELNNEISKVSEHITSYAEKLGLTSSEKYQIEVGVMEAMKVAEKSITIYDKEYSVSGDTWVKSITNAEKVCINDKNIIITDKLTSLTQKFSNKCSELFNIMAKHPVKSVAIILSAVTAISIVAYEISKKKEFNMLDNKDKAFIQDSNNRLNEKRDYIQTVYNNNKELFKDLETSRKNLVDAEFNRNKMATKYDETLYGQSYDDVQNSLSDIDKLAYKYNMPSVVDDVRKKIKNRQDELDKEVASFMKRNY